MAVGVAVVGKGPSGMTQHCDLVIRGGRVVTGDTDYLADVGIQGEAVVQIGGTMRGQREVDAAGKLVIPGGIDAHVHLTPLEEMLTGPHWCDDIYAGTRAAAAGGITAVGNMTFPYSGESLHTAIERDTLAVERDAVVDVFLHPVLTDPVAQPLTDLPGLAQDGHTSLKYFMSFGGFTTQPELYLDAMRIAREVGMITLIHCEDAAILAHATARLLAEGHGAIPNYPRTRPIAAEASATARAAAFAEVTGAPTYIVHLSCAAALEEVRRGRARGVQLGVETRPLYLHLTEERFAEPDGVKYVGQPPLRTRADRVALWSGLANGEINTLCSDHSAWLYADKVMPGIDVTSARPGVADLDTLMPMLYSEGVVTGRISINRFVQVTSTNAAKLFGLYPRKGTIGVGAEADLVVWDPNVTKTLRATDLTSNADYTPYEGWEVTGWPVMTMSRGEIVFRDGEVVARRGRGRLARRGPTLTL
jgi:dihydropyrimidinase